MKQKSKKLTTFKKGDQCVQNPSSKKYRNQVKKNVITSRKSRGGLTLDALEKHNDAMDEELVDFGDLAISEKTTSTNKSKAFSISGLTDCSNITFNKILDKWNSSNELDREKCAVLAAVTEVIRQKGGSETESEYFAALMTALEASTSETSSAAIVYLLNLVMKRVPPSLMKTKFSDMSKCLVQLLEKYSESGKTSLVICCLDCLATALAVQESAIWTEQSTLRCFQILLSFVTNSKPKVRKLAHASVKKLMSINLVNHKHHPIASAVAKFAIRTLGNHSTENSTICHHLLNMLRQTIQYFGPDNLKEVCESILQMLTINNPIMKTNAMQTLHALFIVNPPEENLPSDLNIKLISALYDFQPSVNDAHVTEAWLSLMMAAHANLSLINETACLKMLPKFYGTAMTFFLSEHRSVALSSANIMKETSVKCLEPIIDIVIEDIKMKDSTFSKIFKLIESGLRYKYQPVWDIVLQSLEYLYVTFGKVASSIMLNSVVTLIDMHQSPGFPYLVSLNKAIGAAIQRMGPRIILEKRALGLDRDDDVCEFPNGWLLPVMKDYIQETELQYFIDYFLPIAAHLRQKETNCKKSKQDLEAKVYETLQFQIWLLLPGFCTKPTDIKESFKNIAKILGSALLENKDLRPLVLQTLRTLINKTINESDLKVIGSFSKNYIPILFNLYTSDDEDCQAISLSILETIKTFLIITDEQLISTFVNRILEKMRVEDKAVKRHQLMALAVCMVKYSDADNLRHLYLLALENLQGKDRNMQKKAYRVLEELCDSNSDNCKDLVIENFDKLKTLFVDSLSTAAPSSKAPRLRCISSMIKKLTVDHKDFLCTVIPEVILCTKEVGVKAKNAAFDLLVEIGSSFVFLSNLPKEDCIEEYFHVVMAGLAGSPHMISATLLAFTKMIFEYRYCTSYKLVGSLLDAAITLLKSKTSEVVKSSLLFIRAVVKILDGNELSGHLQTLVKNLFAWNDSAKSAYREPIRRILERLNKKCGYHLVKSFVPDAHKRFIVQIQKTVVRAKRKREQKRNDMDDDETEEKKSGEETTWDDILADSGDEDDKSTRAKQKKKKDKKEFAKTWILENEEGVDLLDSKVAKNIVATKPKKNKKHYGKEGFELSDGKFLIKEEADSESTMHEEKPLDIGEKDLLSGYDKNPKQIKLGKRKMYEDMPEDEEATASSYRPGGHGIHRKRDVDDEPKKKQKRHGDDYKAKKAGGDVKLKGKPDPFAYIPLDRQKLNKRKKAKLQGQFQGMVKAARKGAAAGNKFKKPKRK